MAPPEPLFWIADRCLRIRLKTFCLEGKRAPERLHVAAWNMRQRSLTNDEAGGDWSPSVICPWKGTLNGRPESDTAEIRNPFQQFLKGNDLNGNKRPLWVRRMGDIVDAKVSAAVRLPLSSWLNDGPTGLLETKLLDWGPPLVTAAISVMNTRRVSVLQTHSGIQMWISQSHRDLVWLHFLSPQGPRAWGPSPASAVANWSCVRGLPLRCFRSADTKNGSRGETNKQKKKPCRLWATELRLL